MTTATATANRRTRPSRRLGEPAWEIARLFPLQGDWTEQEYLSLESIHGENIRVELYDGCVEVLPVPTQSHQLILAFLYDCLKAFTTANAAGLVLFSGMRVRIPATGDKVQFREPDVLYMKDEHLERCFEDYWDGADLVMEVVSGDPKDRQRDLEDKPREYARAQIPEYWIIHPDERFIRVLNLRGKSYRVREFGAGTQATSKLLPGFAVSVDEALAAGTPKRKSN